MVTINYLAVLVAAIASMVVGSLWYGPLFSKPWMRLSGLTREHMEKAKAKGMGKLYALAFVGSLLMAYILSHFIEFASAYMGVEGVSVGLSTGFWTWLGFVVPITMGVVLWEGKSWKLWFINSFYYLANLFIMGAIIAGWK